MGRVRVRLGVIAAVVALCAGACGGDSSTGSGGDKPAPKLTGEPIKVAAIGPFEVVSLGAEFPEWPGAVKARAEAINRSGGIQRRPVEVFECNSGNDPNKATQCARDAIAEGVVAVLGFNDPQGDEMYAVLEEAGIPLIGAFPLTIASWTSPISFPISAGGPGAAKGQVLILDGAERVALVQADLGAASAGARLFMDQGMEEIGATETNAVIIPADTTDYAPIVAAATEGDPDGISAFVIGDGLGTFLQTASQQGVDAELSTAGVFLTPDLLDSLGEAAEGLRVASLLNTGDVEGAELFRKDMAAFDADLPTTDLALNYWASMWIFERVAADLPTIDAPSVLAAMGQLENFDMGGISPPLTTTVEFTGPSPLPMPRLFNPTVIEAEVQGGKIQIKSGKFIQLFGE